MSPRPRTVPNEHILGAAQRTMSRLGPARWTLAEVAKDAGLSPATLVQRFGSKRGLMLALWAAAVEGVDACFEDLRPAHASPLDALLAAETMMSRHTRGRGDGQPSRVTADRRQRPAFRRHMFVLSQRTEAGYGGSSTKRSWRVRSSPAIPPAWLAPSAPWPAARSSAGPCSGRASLNPGCAAIWKPCSPRSVRRRRGSGAEGVAEKRAERIG